MKSTHGTTAVHPRKGSGGGRDQWVLGTENTASRKTKKPQRAGDLKGSAKINRLLPFHLQAGPGRGAGSRRTPEAGIANKLHIQGGWDPGAWQEGQQRRLQAGV